MPALPFLSDSDEKVEIMVKSAKKYGADYLLYGGLTLYGDATDDCKTIYFNFLKENYPDLVKEYENLFKGSSSLSKRYQMDLAVRFGEISTRYGIKNSLI
jgi:DNA repair photolyase